MFLMPQFQQVALGQGPLGAGLRLLPWGIAPCLPAPAPARSRTRSANALAVTGLLAQATTPASTARAGLATPAR
jgi:hypothetical protein